MGNFDEHIPGELRQRHIALHPADGFSSAPGRGVTATVDGRTVRVGSPNLLDELANTTAHGEATTMKVIARSRVGSNAAPTPSGMANSARVAATTPIE